MAFGDEFPREALSAFTTDDNLQCMPYTSSPMVIYYNTDLINFERMENRGLPVPPEDREYWTLDMFRAAASFASRPRRVAPAYPRHSQFRWVPARGGC